jgi:hypothetical protein
VRGHSPVACLARSVREVGEEVHDDSRPDSLRHAQERLAVVDVAENWFGAEVAKGFELLSRSCSPTTSCSERCGRVARPRTPVAPAMRMRTVVMQRMNSPLIRT